MNVSEERGKEIKSQRAKELDELRKKGVAKARRTKLKDFASPLTTPEQAQQFLRAMRTQSKKEAWEHKPPTGLSAEGVDAWYMMQRQRDKEMRKRRSEAAELLRGYRAPYPEEGYDFGGWSPKGRRTGRASFGDALSDSLPDPSSSPNKRRQTTMPRLQHNWGEDIMSPEYHRDRPEITPIRPERMSFLNERQHYDGTHYDKPEDRNAFNHGRALFRESDMGSDQPEGRDSIESFRFIDTSESQSRLRNAEERMSVEGRSSRYSVDTFREGPEESRASVDTTNQSTFVEQNEVPETVWRDFISPEPGAKFPPEAGRYHLYASYACPGSHRALIVRALKGLEDIVSVTIVHPTWRHTNRSNSNDKHRGWIFGNPEGEPFHNTTGRGGPFPPAYPGNEPDPILNAYSVRELYEHAQDTSGKYTIPLLWDKKLNTIVNNESSDISYMLNSCFNDFSTDPDFDLYTEDDEDGLDKLNEVSQWLYPMMIHGVYRCGFAKTQEAYDHAITELTDAFDMADELLQEQRYLTGDTLTDADIRLFVTLLRFDEVYAFYFRANTRLVMLTPALLNFCREIYQMPGVADTCQMDQIKAHFFGSHAEWNKYSVIPKGLGFMPLLNQPHNREEIEPLASMPPPRASSPFDLSEFDRNEFE